MASSSIEELRQKDGVRAFLREVERREEDLDFNKRVHELAFRGDIEGMRKTLEELREFDENGFDINQRHPRDGRTYLHSAAIGVPSSMIDYLVQKWGAYLDCRDNRGRTPLLHAAINGFTRVMTRLIALGAETLAVDDDGMGALMLAAQGGHIKSVIFLHYAGVDVCNHARDGRTALHVAAYAGQTSVMSRDCMIEKLRDIGADLNAVTLNGFVPLHYAALGNQPATIHKLFSLGADLDFMDMNGITPLMIAADCGNLKSVQVLIELGADCRKVDKRGYSALHFAGNKNRIPVARYLLGKIPPISSRATLATHLKEITEWSTYRGDTAMSLAAQKKHHKMVELFSMALLYGDVPTMPGNLLMIQLDIFGITLGHGATLDLGRVKLMTYLKRVLDLKKSELPMY